MLTGMIGEKLRMWQRFAKDGKVLPVTEVLVGPVTVVQIKTKEKDGYAAIQLAYGQKKSATKPILGIAKKAGVNRSPKVLAEFPVQGEDLPKLGETFTVDQIFDAGDLVKVTGTSKGKGFTGVVKAWGFAGGPASHGQTDRLRAPGSIGQSTIPGRVAKGKKMAGRTGSEKVTVKNLQVLEIDSNCNLLVLAGSVPGGPKSILKIEKIGVAKKPTELFVKETKVTKEVNETKDIKEEKDAKESETKN